MQATEIYRQWCESPFLDKATKEELDAIAEQPEEIADRFYKWLEFGTAGLRGKLGAGTNRINLYTVRRATQGLAQQIATLGDAAKAKGVAIAYDSRHLSPELALEAACTLAANGIRAYLFESLRPTPELSFAVRDLQAQAGIVITASHNPPEYNGYKVYWADGAQIASAIAQAITAEIDRVADFSAVRTCTREEAERAGLLQWIGTELDDRYMAQLRELCLNREAIAESDLRIVYTPLHGAANESLKRILREVGFAHVHAVPEQELPDPNFPTVKAPNPEERAAFDLAIRLAEERGADLIVGTDPDGDRVGVVVRNAEGDYEVLTGNQTGALLVHYLLSERAKRGLLPKGGTIIKTIVTNELGRLIAEKYGVETLNTLTGFKYIGEQMRLFEETGERAFLFGYEESYGYLAAPFVRDKDGVMITMLVCEMAAFYKQKGVTLYEALQALYDEFGYFRERLLSRTLQGRDGLAQIGRILEAMRAEPLSALQEIGVVERRDYLFSSRETASGETSVLQMPQENVLHYTLADGSWFCLRPSGTEPKIKVYLAVQGQTATEAEARLERLETDVLAKMGTLGGF